jgi:hypothetical protein
MWRLFMMESEDDEVDDVDEEEFEPESEEDALERERRDAEADVFNQLDKVIASWSTPPKSLAHYTSIQNGVRIVERGEMWLFNAYTMNDEQEIDHAIDLISDQLEVSEFAELGDLMREQHEFSRWGRRSVYVFCLSRVDDLDRLWMWRAYGDDGNGVALKIRTGALLKSRNQKMPGLAPLLSEVVYDNAIKEKRIQALFSRFEKACEEHDNFSKQDLLGAPSSNLWKIAPTFKHPSFSEEREWRVVIEVDKPFLSTSTDSSSLIEFFDDRRPFVRFTLGTEQGEGILGLLSPSTFEGALVGPSRNSRANAAMIGAALLKRHRASETDISGIPYRGR